MSKKRIGRNIIGRQIRQLRYQQGLTQEVLAAKCQLAGLDISRSALAQVEALYRGVSDKEALLFAKVLKVSIADIYLPKK